MVKIGKSVSELQQKTDNRALEEHEELFTVDLTCELIEKATGKKCGDMYQASQIIWDVLFQGYEAREKLFKTFLEVSTNVNYDWLNKPFQQELAERTKKKQDYTNHVVADLLDELIEVPNRVDDNYSRYDIGAGTGTLTIAKWNGDRHKHSPFDYRPSMYWYVAEEYKEEGVPSYVMPFLLFNFLIRGMNGVVIAGDSLTRSVSQVYFIQNVPDDHLKFSSLNVMPRTEMVAKEFDVRKWIDEPIEYVEDKLGWGVDDDGSQSLAVYNDQTLKDYDKKRQQAQHEKDMLDGMLNIVKKQNEANPNAGKIKDMPKDDRDNLGDQLDGILKIFGVTPDPQIRKQYFG